MQKWTHLTIWTNIPGHNILIFGHKSLVTTSLILFYCASTPKSIFATETMNIFALQVSRLEST